MKLSDWFGIGYCLSIYGIVEELILHHSDHAATIFYLLVAAALNLVMWGIACYIRNE